MAIEDLDRDCYRVEVVVLETGEIVNRINTHSEQAAKRTERGLLINLNDAKYYVRVTDPLGQPRAQ